MQFTETPIAKAYVLEPSLIQDERGLFARAFCQQAMAERGLKTDFPQHNLGASFKKGTLRGLHYQLPPVEEAKLVRCIQGEVYDMLVDMRPDSPTFGQHYGVLLSSSNRKAFYVPAGCAHGYLTLTPNAEVLYMASHAYVAGNEVGVRYNDPALKLSWPEPIQCISQKDENFPLLAPAFFKRA
jgi:dTDP-4-dehydrorhamnose 3,5-epimerase